MNQQMKQDIAAKVWELKLEKEYEQQGICPVCVEPVSAQTGELSHRIPQRKWCIAKWGPAIIHHKMNQVLTHPGRCNSAVSIGNHPLEMEKLARIIRKELIHDSE